MLTYNHMTMKRWHEENFKNPFDKKSIEWDTLKIDWKDIITYAKDKID